MRLSSLVLSACCCASASVLAADGGLDAAFGEAGRRSFGFVESDQVQMRAFARSPQGRLWLFGEAPDDPAALFIARMDAAGQPDAGFGPGGDGRRRTTLPTGLIAQTEALALDGAVLQADGKPIVFGGLRAVPGETGAYPAIVCRLAVAGGFDTSFDGDGCRTLRALIADDEVCRITDAAIGPDGQISVVGNCTAHDRPESPFVARLSADGVPDAGFGGGTGLVPAPLPLPGIESQHYEALVVRPDRRIAVLGQFLLSSGNALDLELGLLQFDTAGGLDASFNGNGIRTFAFDLGADDADRARDLVLRPDGRLLALGEATLADPPMTVALLAGVLPDGTPDGAVGSDGRRIEDADGTLGANAALASLELDGQGRALIAAREVTGQPDAITDTGTDFWIGFPRTADTEPEQQFVKLLISSGLATTGTISNAALGIAIPFATVADATTEITLPIALQNPADVDLPLPLGVHVLAQAPVSIVAINGRRFSLDSFVATPTDRLGREYRLMAWGDGLGPGSQLVVTAVQNATTVWITPAVAVAGHAAGVPYAVTLQRGQTYYLWANGSGDQDLSGTHIVADKPVAVLGGHTCAQVPDGLEFCDLAIEQQQPVETWGTRFVFTPSPLLPGGEHLRVLAHEGDTRVWLDGVAVATLDAGATYDVLRSAPAVVTTSRPAAAAKLAPSCAVHGLPDCYGDPNMLLLPSTRQWSSRQHAVVPTPLFGLATDQRITLVVPAARVDQVFFDDVLLSPGLFTPIGDGSYAVATLVRAPRSYTVSAPEPIMVAVDGYAGRQAHAHAGAGAPFLEVGTSTGSADDALLRLTPALSRDRCFGQNGRVTIDHTSHVGGATPSIDTVVRAFADGGGVLVGSAVRNSQTGEQRLLAYRLIAEALFCDDFEEE
ncbi:MAG: hypothetical protein DI564_12570 [Rhodanobacter denitrificans]|uniref:IgGFc-binding protein N-terminal domain-containing protein n=1 Tax=Rhodanobacter denitrificans TaxID=666685 RepID=A0A2W5K6K2_9GAMM|nr:MAG: hypothetical protein DI564_12570 [Rhodanobacter denitrificans]